LARPVNINTVVPEVLGLGIPKGIIKAELDMEVLKSGRTTSVTKGIITALDITILIVYPNVGPVLFIDQICSTSKSETGDSGSIVARALVPS
jgi:hypothetical protein